MLKQHRRWCLTIFCHRHGWNKSLHKKFAIFLDMAVFFGNFPDSATVSYVMDIKPSQFIHRVLSVGKETPQITIICIPPKWIADVFNMRAWILYAIYVEKKWCRTRLVWLWEWSARIEKKQHNFLWSDAPPKCENSPTHLDHTCVPVMSGTLDSHTDLLPVPYHRFSGLVKKNIHFTFDNGPWTIELLCFSGPGSIVLDRNDGPETTVLLRNGGLNTTLVFWNGNPYTTISDWWSMDHWTTILNIWLSGTHLVRGLRLLTDLSGPGPWKVMVASSNVPHSVPHMRHYIPRDCIRTFCEYILWNMKVRETL